MSLERMQKVFRDILDLPNLNLGRSTSTSEVDQWDSISHINLIIALEKEFRIKFKTSEIVKLNNVGAIQDLIDSKL